jgi:hypothetical protein
MLVPARVWVSTGMDKPRTSMRQDDITRLREMVAAFNACVLALLADPTDPLTIVQARYLTAKADKLEQDLAAHHPTTSFD